MSDVSVPVLAGVLARILGTLELDGFGQRVDVCRAQDHGGGGDETQLPSHQLH